VGPETPVTPVGLVGLADPATPVGLVDPAGRVTVVDPGDMNRVVAATVGTAAAMDPADLASREVPVVRVGMTLEDPEDPVDMILEDPVGLVGMILGDPEGRLRVPNPVGRVDPERLVVPNPAVPVDPGNREATDLSLGRALLGRMPMRRHPTAARPVRTPMLLHLTPDPVPMPALPHLTPADRRRDPTTRAVATCQEATRAVATRRAEATPAEATRAVATRRAETRRAEATHPADPTDPRPRHFL
jgi:hypothetical protein